MNKRISISVKESTYNLLKTLANVLAKEKETDISISEAVRLAAKEKLEKYEGSK